MGSATVDTEQVLVLEGFHLGIIIIGEIAYTAQSTVDDGDFPSLTIVDLACAWQETEKECLGRVVRLLHDGLDNHGRLNTDLLAMGEGKCEQENKKKESPQKVLEMQPCGGSIGEVIALGFRHVGRAVSLFCQNPHR